MGLPEISLNAPAAASQQDEKTSKVQAKTKLTDEEYAKSELPKALSQGKKDTANVEQKALMKPLAMPEKSGFSKGEKMALGATLLGAAATILSFVKPSAGKALKLAAHAAPAAKKGLQAKHAVGVVAGLAGTAILGSCGKLEDEHNLYVKIPTDTVDREKIVEKIIEKIITVTETDTVIQHDTLEVPVYIPGKDSIVYKDSIVHDTTYIDRLVPYPVPGETIYVNTDFKSEVPEKIKEMLNDLGIDSTGVGQFVYGLDWQDAKNNQVHRTLWDGGRTSRDGDVYIMNDIGTKWSNPDEKYVFGKNEQFKRHELYLDGSKNLSDCQNTPLSPINVSNGNDAPNWFIFESGQPTAEPGNWVRNTPATFTKIADGKWQSSDGFIYEKGDKPNSIKKTNSHGSEWLLKDVSIIGGNDAKDPQK